MRLDCCRCQGIENTFDERGARSDMKEYQRKGPKRTTRILIEAIAQDGVEGYSLMDVGGGVGIILHEMNKLGISKSVSVDASSAYLAFARQEAERLGTADRATFHQGNFVEVAPKLEPADIVTLDRVICCYDDMPSLVSSSAALSKKFYGVVLPIDNWLAKAAVMIGNFFLWLSRNPFRIYAHPTKEVEEIVLAEGLHRIFYNRVGFWQVIVYGR